ncbi:MAG: DNA-directed RNA polymerase subunit beta, partial [Desulfobacteraceae bacterium]|nr:DNA-directed RNA polymerase subunit beta [Desulfobacteraceae bacterium]
QVIADGPATEMGELALGKNVTVAFMPWDGYNYEDSILVSERLVREGVYTSVHIEEFEVVARDTKLGKEEITRDIPNVGEEALKDLDESGIIRLGAEVKSGDILVGKVTPKGETQLSPEEKLLRAIFGEKAGDVKDTSLRVPPGIQGKVIDAKVFSRRGVEKDERTRMIEDEEIDRLEKNRDDEILVINDIAKEKIVEVLNGFKLSEDLRKGSLVLAKAGSVVTKELFSNISISNLSELTVDDPSVTDNALAILENAQKQIKKARDYFNSQISRFEKGDDLPPGVLKLIKIDVAMKRVLSVGDKMAGRHGNKGVVSRVLPIEDLPYFEDGKSVDMVLNPLGVPSRMNVGQILEIHLGRAAQGLGGQIETLMEDMQIEEMKQRVKKIFTMSPSKKQDNKEDKDFIKKIDVMDDKSFIDFVSQYKNGVHMATPVFDGATEEEIKDLLEYAGI